MKEWTFITNHGGVLSVIARHKDITAREIARELDITERSVHRIISDLEAEKYIQKTKIGRVNQYELDPTLPLRLHNHRDVSIGSCWIPCCRVITIKTKRPVTLQAF